MKLLVTGAQGQVDCETATDPTTGLGLYGNLDCLEKGDKIFLLALGDRDPSKCEGANSAYANIAGFDVGAADSCYYKSTQDSFQANPMYPNMYTVQKIGKLPKDINNADQKDWFQLHDGTWSGSDNSALHREGYRHQITLDMGVNAQYMMNSFGSSADLTSANGPDLTAHPDVKASIYKFYPPSLDTTESDGYNYVAECSNRGLCNQDEGLCECFTGFTGADCGTINSLTE